MSLVLERPHGVLSDPFLSCDVSNQQLPGFLESIADVGKHLPVRCVISDQVVTGVTISAACVSIQGQPIHREAK